MGLWRRLRALDSAARLRRAPPEWQPGWGPVWSTVDEMRRQHRVLLSATLVAVTLVAVSPGLGSGTRVADVTFGLVVLVLDVAAGQSHGPWRRPQSVAVRRLPVGVLCGLWRLRWPVAASWAAVPLLLARFVVVAHGHPLGALGGAVSPVLGMRFGLTRLQRVEGALGGRLVRLQHPRRAPVVAGTSRMFFLPAGDTPVPAPPRATAVRDGSATRAHV